MDGTIGEVLGTIGLLATAANSFFIWRNNQLTAASKKISEGNAQKLDVMHDKVEHLHTCVETKADEIKEAVLQAPVTDRAIVETETRKDQTNA